MTQTATVLINDVNVEAVAGLAAEIVESPEVAATVWHADVTWKGGFRSESKVRDFDPVVSDEPESLGGTDRGPNPVEQLLAALHAKVTSTSPVGHTLFRSVPLSVDLA